MKRLLALIVALGGAGLLFARLRNRRQVGEPVPVADPRAEELRRKLAENRTAPGASPAGEGSSDAPVPDAAEVSVARQRVYDRGRMAVDEMQRAGTEPPL